MRNLLGLKDRCRVSEMGCNITSGEDGCTIESKSVFFFGSILQNATIGVLCCIERATLLRVVLREAEVRI
jgi:hypothetical protein